MRTAVDVKLGGDRLQQSPDLRRKDVNLYVNLYVNIYVNITPGPGCDISGL